MEWASAKKVIVSAIEHYYQEQIANRKKMQEDRISRAEQILKTKRSKE